jgi:hypothetical protein
MWSNTLIPKNVGEPISSRYDDRKGLGYGQLKQKFHKPRSADNTFPYIKPDDPIIDEIEIDDESYAAVNKKTLKFQMTDPGDVKTSDPLYFVGAATKLRACFERPDKILEEIMKLGKGILILNEYGVQDESSMSIGGFSSWKAFDTSPYKRTGTKRGWSEIPPLSKVDDEDEVDEDEFYSLDDLADIQKPTLGEGFYINRYI